ncbi:MAG: hypothetical protein WC162_08690 [Sphaerochaetaceae bacterium]|nr:hypothetical protein [Sphaerochaetaceae bacterium]
MSKNRLRSVLRKFSKKRKAKKQEHIEALSPEIKLKKSKALKKGSIIAEKQKPKETTSGIKILPREENNFVNKPKKAKIEKPAEVIKEKKESVNEIKNIQEKLDKILEEIDQAKTPKGADEDIRAEFNEKRKALRKERDLLKKQLEEAK